MKSKITKVWVVTGSTGEYSDRSDWEVCAYINEADAKKHVKLVTKWYKDNGGTSVLYDNRRDIKCPYDPNIRIDYTGTTWSCYPLEVRSSLPDFEVE